MRLASSVGNRLAKWKLRTKLHFSSFLSCRCLPISIYVARRAYFTFVDTTDFSPLLFILRACWIDARPTLAPSFMKSYEFTPTTLNSLSMRRATFAFPPSPHAEAILPFWWRRLKYMADYPFRWDITSHAKSAHRCFKDIRSLSLRTAWR